MVRAAGLEAAPNVWVCPPTPDTTPGIADTHARPRATTDCLSEGKPLGKFGSSGQGSCGGVWSAPPMLQINARACQPREKACAGSPSELHFGMGSATFVEDFNEAFEFTPVEGRPNEYVIHSKLPRHNAENEMTPEDWDKFEKDIEDAFEQVP